MLGSWTTFIDKTGFSELWLDLRDDPGQRNGKQTLVENAEYLSMLTRILDCIAPE
jgi:hypothetical protein